MALLAGMGLTCLPKPLYLTPLTLNSDELRQWT